MSSCADLECVCVCVLDRGDRGSVVHLRGRVVCDRWSGQSFLHQSVGWHAAAQMDGLFTGVRLVHQYMGTKCVLWKCNVCSVFVWRSYFLQITRAQRLPFIRSSRCDAFDCEFGVGRWMWLMMVLCWQRRVAQRSRQDESVQQFGGDLCVSISINKKNMIYSVWYEHFYSITLIIKCL